MTGAKSYGARNVGQAILLMVIHATDAMPIFNSSLYVSRSPARSKARRQDAGVPFAFQHAPFDKLMVFDMINDASTPPRTTNIGSEGSLGMTNSDTLTLYLQTSL